MEREYRHSLVLTRPPLAPTEEASLRTRNMATRLQELVKGGEMRLPRRVRIRPLADGLRIEQGQNATCEIRLPVVMTVAESSADRLRSLHHEACFVLRMRFRTS